MSEKWMEYFLQGFLFDDADSYQTTDQYRSALNKQLKESGLTERKNVRFLSNEKIEKMLVSSRKPENSAFYPFLPSGTITRFTYQTPSGTESREIKADPYLSNEELERLWELLYESDEWKEQTFPYVLDPKGISQIWIQSDKLSIDTYGIQYQETFPVTPT